MEEISTLNRRLSLLKRRLSPQGIQIKAESPAWSQVQGVLARGDARIAEVLANTEEVSLSGWRKAIDKCQLDTNYYLSKRWDTSGKLPWSVIDSGMAVDHLETELKKALS
jgi:hypothetical protein